MVCMIISGFLLFECNNFVHNGVHIINTLGSLLSYLAYGVASGLEHILMGLAEAQQ